MERTIRYSKKREAILNAIRSTRVHPTAEWVYQNLKPAHPDLSLGTVYRNLSFFQEQGMIKSVGVVNGQERFDADLSAHSHFICRSCGAVYDIPQPAGIGSPDQTTGACRDFQVDSCEVIFRGKCSQCVGETKH